MTFPKGTVISTANVDSPDDDPSLARIDIYNLIVAFNQLVASVDAAGGAVTLDNTGKIRSINLPSNYTSTAGNVSISPASGVVNINKVARLYPINADDLGAVAGTTTPAQGDLCFLSNGDAGLPCLSVYDGNFWRIVRLATQVGSAGADLISSTTLACDAEIV